MLRMLTLAMLLMPLSLCGCESSAKDQSAKDNKLPPPARVSDPVFAYVDSMRQDLSTGKVHIINQVMRLTPEESKIFWPIYHDYEEELFDLGDHRVELTREFVKAQAGQTLDNEKAAALTDGWFKFETQRLELLEKYQKMIAKELSPIRAAQFAQIEHRVGTVVDLLLASQLPLVQSPKGPQQ